MFNYVEGLITETSANFTLRMLNDEFSTFFDAWTVRFDFVTIRRGEDSKDSIPQQLSWPSG
jgi:hypothetical protein